VPPEVTETELGETVTETGVAGGITVTNALAPCVGSAALVALTVTLVLLVTIGAVKKPVLEIVPELADQDTAVLLVPCTVAENC
jgi:hypothetical protein